MKLLFWFVFAILNSYLADQAFSKFTDEEQEAMEKGTEKFSYEADISRIMKIIINSLYKNKEIFLRELISNCNDALGKIKFMSFTQSDVLDTNPELSIWIDYNETDMKLTVRDSGIGMTKADLIKHLGTIAKSGTSDFLKKLQEAEKKGITEQESAMSQIGQFGVGFYSAFLVADKVTVVSKHNDDDQYIWESDSVEFNVTKDPRGNTLGRGTAVILHMKKQGKEYLQWTRLKELITRYSAFIDYPIKLWGEVFDDEDTTGEKKTEAKPEGDDKSEKKEEESTEKTGDEDVKSDEETKSEEEADDGTPKKKYGYTLINSVKPMWMRDPKNITDEEYLEFYRSLKNDPKANYLAKIHFVAEGDIVFRALLYIPDTLPQQFSKEDEEPSGNIKLYVKRVYIKSDSKTILPSYLSYVSGVVDSDDLPLNVGRESLQHVQLVKVIKKKVVRKIIDAVSKFNVETQTKFYNTFAVSLKYGAIVDTVNRNRILKILRYPSTHDPKGNMTTFPEYMSRMKDRQDKIYFLTSGELDDCLKSHYVTPFVAKGYEVLCMIDPMDEYTFTHISDYENRKFQNVAKKGAELPDDDKSEEQKEMEKEYKPLTDHLVKHAKLSLFIESTEVVFDIEPACMLIANQFGFTGSMERIYHSQTSQSHVEKQHMQETLKRKKHLRLNGYHPLVKAMLDIVEDGNEGSEDFAELARTCYSIGQLYGGFVTDNFETLANVMQDVSVKALGQNPKEVRDRIKEKIKIKTEDKNKDKNEDSSEEKAEPVEEL